jgi:hypothetical protein
MDSRVSSGFASLACGPENDDWKERARLIVSVGETRMSLNGDLSTFVILGPAGERSEPEETRGSMP